MANLRWLLATATFLLMSGWHTRADDWPQWRGPNRDAVWHEAGIMQAFPREGLKTTWRVLIGRGFSSPVVAAGRVYLTDVQAARPPAKERVLCLDASTGEKVWERTYDCPYQISYPSGPRATPTVSDGRLFTLGGALVLFPFVEHGVAEIFPTGC